MGYLSCHCFSLSALELIKTAIEKAGFTDKVVIGMDVAASEFFIEGKYDLDFKSPPNVARNISADELASIYQGFINNYPGVNCNFSVRTSDYSPAKEVLIMCSAVHLASKNLPWCGSLSHQWHAFCLQVCMCPSAFNMSTFCDIIPIKSLVRMSVCHGKLRGFSNQGGAFDWCKLPTCLSSSGVYWRSFWSGRLACMVTVHSLSGYTGKNTLALLSGI